MRSLEQRCPATNSQGVGQQDPQSLESSFAAIPTMPISSQDIVVWPEWH
jgi:hypothetical protein